MKYKNIFDYTEALKERGYYCTPTFGYDCGKFKQPKCEGGFYSNNLSVPNIFERYGSDYWNKTACSIWCGTFLAVDCDGEMGTNQFIELMKILNVPFDIERDYTIKTPKNGYHIYYQAPENLALIKNVSKWKIIEIDGKQREIDIRTSRGYVVCPGVQRQVNGEWKCYFPNERFRDSNDVLIPAYQLPECPKPLLDILPLDDCVTERQKELLSLLPEPYRYIYEYAENYKSESIEIDVDDVKANPYYYPTENDMRRVIGKAKNIDNSNDCDEYGRVVEGHRKTMKIISFVLRVIAEGDVNVARTIIDEWNCGLDWAWSENDLDRMFVKVAKTSRNVELMFDKF